MKTKIKTKIKHPKRTFATTLVSSSTVFPEGFISEQEAAAYLGCSRSNLAMLRMRWREAGSGTGTGTDGRGPMWFEGPSGRIAYRVEDLERFRDRMRDVRQWTPAPGSRGRK